MANGTDGKKPDESPDVPHERAGDRPDFSTLPPRKQLPKSIQATLDSEEKLWDVMYEGKAEDSTESNIRYAAYASRLRTILLSAHRYVAYTSDIGESFRPVAHPYLVRGAYGVSWAYLVGDVGHEGYKAYVRNQRVLHPELHTEKDTNEEVRTHKGGKAAGVLGSMGEGLGVLKAKEKLVTTGGEGDVMPGRVSAIQDYKTVMIQRALFQGVASMGLPAFTIHSIVRYSGRALKNAANKNIRIWAPIGLGLSAVPALPYMFDAPVEYGTEWLFYNGFKTFGGEKAVEGQAPPQWHGWFSHGHHGDAAAIEKKEL